MTNLKKRKKAELRFKSYGIFSVFLSLLFVAILMVNIFSAGIGGFYKTVFVTSIHFDQNLLNLDDNPSEEQIQKSSFRKLIKYNFNELFKDYSKDEIKQIKKLFYRKIDIELKNFLIKNPEFLNQTTNVDLTASTHIDQIHKGNFDRTVPEKRRSVNNLQLNIYDKFIDDKKVKKVWNSTYFTSGDSRDPESAGVASSVMGSVFTILICFLLSLSYCYFCFNLFGRVCKKRKDDRSN